MDTTKDVLALNKYEEIKKLAKNSATYFFMPDGNATHEDEWEESQSASGDYWSYTFAEEDEQVLLDYYLDEADKQAVDHLCQVLYMGETEGESFHHALYCVLKEYR